MSRTAAQPNPAAAAPADRRGFNLPSLDGLRAVSVVIVFVSIPRRLRLRRWG